MLKIFTTSRLNPIKEALRSEILDHLRGVTTGYRASYIKALINGGTHIESRYAEKQIDEMLDSMVQENYLRIESGNFKTIYD
jgi:hypothetical protein